MPKKGTVAEKHILSVIHWIRKQQQRPHQIPISTYLNRKHGLSKSDVKQTINYMLDSAAIYSKPRNGKDSYYIFDPLNLCKNKDKDIDSETDRTRNLEPRDVITPAKDTESSLQLSGSPVIQTSKKHSCETFDTTYGFLGAMGKIG